MWNFEVGTKSKDSPYISNYIPIKIGEFWASGRSPFPISKFR
jgi:hypothetical protein